MNFRRLEVSACVALARVAVIRFVQEMQKGIGVARRKVIGCEAIVLAINANCP